MHEQERHGNGCVIEDNNNNVGDGKDENVKRNLPKLPLPSLSHTITRYLECLKAILGDDAEKFEEVRSLCQSFETDYASNTGGPALQTALQNRREILDNWAYEWWLDDMYLANQVCLPINSNPGMVFPPRNFAERNNEEDGEVAELRVQSMHAREREMALFGAAMVTAAVQFKKLLDSGEFPTDTANVCYSKEELKENDGEHTGGQKTQPLCMSQYYRIFTSYREPGIAKDSLVKCETEYTKNRPHIVVIFKNQFYVVHLTKGSDAEYLSMDEISRQLFDILTKRESDDEPAVGLLTTLPRNCWARNRTSLMKDERNRMNLCYLERCLLVLCYDVTETEDFSRGNSPSEGVDEKNFNRDDTSLAQQMIHGGGYNNGGNTGNRWFDKTVQVIIGSDGANGLCYEHSPAEGVAVIRAMEYMLDSTNQSLGEIERNRGKFDVGKPSTTAEKLHWNISLNIMHEIQSAGDIIDGLIRDLDFLVYRFGGYGKKFIKTCRVSPDAYIQLALQLAYYKMYGHLTATYESASTRRFMLGRVDCIRACTMEALNWAKGMRNFNKTAINNQKELKTLFSLAIEQQTEITTENITGRGIDVHLLGLRKAAEQVSSGAAAVRIFQHDTYNLANHFSLSTSQVATNMDSYMGYGPVVNDGYGASYNPKSESIIFCLSSFHSGMQTNTRRFAIFLEESLRDMKLLLGQFE